MSQLETIQELLYIINFLNNILSCEKKQHCLTKTVQYSKEEYLSIGKKIVVVDLIKFIKGRIKQYDPEYYFKNFKE